MNLGKISALFRYPVKSMAGEPLDVAKLGWHGIEGDRRFALRRLNDKSNFPWLSASKLPELILYKPFGLDSNSAELLPTHVRTPDGKKYELHSDELREEISKRFGSDVELMNLKSGVFDEASISVITSSTVQCIERESGRGPGACDIRRFRPNIVMESYSAEPFEEDRWVGQTLIFGEGDDCAVVKVYMKDERCRMVNLDPDTAERDVQVMRAVARLNKNYAGGYGTVVRAGELRVGQVVRLSG
ncbi:MAG TPA: MOSC domain-containing protein [Pyrinomonadaceae bacterium]|nr:MOSC domain-containing protein [Pyrinomonadaceae bacterium]